MIRSVARGAALAACLLLGSAWAAPARAQDESYKPDVAAASPEAQQAAKSFKVPAGTKLSLFAAEPLLANPVAFSIDEKGRFFVCETFRHHAGVTDNRNHMVWLDADMACRTVDDRVAMYRKYLSKDEFAGYNVEHERVRRIVDTDGDGKADTATVFADGFKDAADGIGAGVLARKGDVFYTCIPEVWKLKDTDDDGKADVKQSLSKGYGVHVAFLGHDLHGLKMGPDGRLYFSIGDRGLNVTTKEGKHLFAPDTGSVLRCEPDGSNLEIFASGLRNPQELAFDDHGNWFTCDNNSDGGDKARWVHLVEGGDSGWRMGYQYLDFPMARGPWNAEKVWIPRWDGQANYILPPLLNISDGPSGLTHDPGTGLPAKYRDHFFLADFRGSSSNSGIRTWANKPKGASFELVDPEQFLWSVLATDVDFGPDGSLYVTDWTNGWNKPMKGRIWKVTPDETDPNVAPTQKLIAEGMTGRPVAELAQLLGYVDQRVRLEAQYELAERALSRPEAMQALVHAARSGESPQSMRIHAIWALGQVARRSPANADVLTDLTRDGDSEIRAQAARTLGDVAGRHADFAAALLPLLKDESPRVRFYAALGLGHHGAAAAVAPILAMVRDNNDADAYLRHAGVMALAGVGDAATLAKAASDPSAAVRLGAVLALRRLGRGEVAAFLNDADPKIATEAGLAIYEAPIDSALPELAALAARKDLPEPLLRRAINAANRVGTADSAKNIGQVAARGDASKNARVEALSILATWVKPPGRDRINGLWRPVGDGRTAEPAAAALAPVVPGILKDAPDDVRIALLKAVAELKVVAAGPELVAMLANNFGSAEARVEAIKALEKIDDPQLGAAIGRVIESKDARVRAEGLRVLARLSPERAIPALARVMEVGSTTEKQKALDVLGAARQPAADAVVAQAIDRQLAHPDPKIALELAAAAAKRSAPEVRERASKLAAQLPQSGPLAGYTMLLEGGDFDRGKKVFAENNAVYCVRCHKVNDNGGEVGPNLSDVGKKHPREYLLESIVAPNQAIAQGFESVVVGRSDGQVVAGVFKSEDDKTLRLMTAEAKLIEIPKSDIDERTRGASAMPEELHKKLSPTELRDLVEYLANLK